MKSAIKLGLRLVSRKRSVESVGSTELGSDTTGIVWEALQGSREQVSETSSWKPWMRY